MSNRPMPFCICLLLVTALLSGCMEHYNTILKFRNNSKEFVTVFYSDRELPGTNAGDYIEDWNGTPPDSTHIIDISKRDDTWHYYIKRSPSKTLFLYVFSAAEFTKYRTLSQHDAMQSLHYQKIYKFSEQELIEKKWLVEYPGDK